jgi:hypothetical protein
MNKKGVDKNIFGILNRVGAAPIVNGEQRAYL